MGIDDDADADDDDDDDKLVIVERIRLRRDPVYEVSQIVVETAERMIVRRGGGSGERIVGRRV